MTSDKIIQILKSLCVVKFYSVWQKKFHLNILQSACAVLDLSLKEIWQKVHYLLEQPYFELYLSVCACMPLFESLRGFAFDLEKKFLLFFMTIYKEEMASS